MGKMFLHKQTYIQNNIMLKCQEQNCINYRSEPCEEHVYLSFAVVQVTGMLFKC